MKTQLLTALLLGWSLAQAQVTTIQGTDSISSSRTTINNNFSYLDGIVGAIGTTTPVEGLDTTRGLKFHHKVAKALVTFELDDSRATHYTQVLPLFQSKSAVGDIAVITGAVGTTNYMTQSQVVGFQTAGWEIMAHTKTHPNLTTLTDSQVLDETYGARQVLTSWGLSNVESLSIPYDTDNQHIRDIYGPYFRGVTEVVHASYNSFPLDMQRIDRYVLSAGSFPILSTLTDLVDAAATNKGWLVFVFDGDPSGGDLTELGQLLDYIQAKPVPIVTYHQALDQIGNYIESPYLRLGVNGNLTGGEYPLNIAATQVVAYDPVNNKPLVVQDNFYKIGFGFGPDSDPGSYDAVFGVGGGTLEQLVRSGRFDFYSTNSGLDEFSIRPGYIQVPASTTTPTCSATGDIGKVWFDNTTTTTAVKFCLSVSGTMAWHSATVN